MRQRRRFRTELCVEQLGDRLVPAVVDLTTAGSAGVINGAVFQQSDPQPTGTGFIRSFVRLQTNAPQEQGYNTDARPLQFDENNSPQFTRSIQLGNVPMVTEDGVLYRQFLLDINQRGSAPLLSLDELRIYLGDSPNLRGYSSTTKQLAGLPPAYDLDAGGVDNWVKMNYRLNHGSGSGDIFVLIPATALGANGDAYVYLYSAFGQNHAANAGFEEWAVRSRPSPSTPPAVELSRLAGNVYVDTDNDGFRDLGEVGIADVVIQLSGVNDLGENVTLTARTDITGAYAFEGLRPGVYSLLEVQPDGFEDGMDRIGTQGGRTQNDRFFDIFLAAGVNGIDNNFGELLFAGS